MFNLGHSRSRTAGDHFLLTPDTFIRSPFPGMRNAVAIVHVSPTAGADISGHRGEKPAHAEH